MTAEATLADPIPDGGIMTRQRRRAAARGLRKAADQERRRDVRVERMRASWERERSDGR